MFTRKHRLRHPNTKLNEEKVKALITEFRKGNISQVEIAKKYNVSPSCVNHITAGRNWEDVTGIRISR